MPQLSLYIDKETLEAIELRAKTSGTSISKYVTAALQSYLSDSWPQGYWDVFGSVTDDGFAAPEALQRHNDAKREEL